MANPSQHPIGDQGDDIIWTDRGGQKQIRCSEEEIVVKKHNVIFERACHVIFGPVIFCPGGRNMIAIFGPDKI